MMARYVSHDDHLLQKMPRHRAVPTLQSLSLKAVGSLVVSLSQTAVASIDLYSKPEAGQQNCLDWLGELLSYVPVCLYDSMANQVLHVVKYLFEQTKKELEESIAVTPLDVVASPMEVILNPHLKRIDFSIWPEIMQLVLYKNLVKLSGLEVLILGRSSCAGLDGWKNKYILDGIVTMKQLRSLYLSFHCTDNIMQILSDNCPHLQTLDVTSSQFVTDHSIPSLLKCHQLRNLQLHRTSVSIKGYAELLVGMKKLQNIGECDEFGRVVKYIYKYYPNSGPFGLKKFRNCYLTIEDLRLIVDICPNIEHLSLLHNKEFFDLTVLATLENLRDFKLRPCKFYTHYLNRLLEIRGCNLTNLQLEEVKEIDFDALVDVSQYCPHLKYLFIHNCDFIDQSAPRRGPFEIKPFERLESLFWFVDSGITHLEFLLMNAVNIQSIYLISLTHSTVVRLLAVNPMKHLEELRVNYSSDMSMRTVEMLLTSCCNLRLLSDLENWQGISVKELKVFRDNISSNNFDIDIGPNYEIDFLRYAPANIFRI